LQVGSRCTKRRVGSNNLSACCWARSAVFRKDSAASALQNVRKIRAGNWNQLDSNSFDIRTFLHSGALEPTHQKDHVSKANEAQQAKRREFIIRDEFITSWHSEAAQIARDISEAGSYFQFNQLPELYSALAGDITTFPVQYIGANVPQAWAAGSVFMLMQAMLGFFRTHLATSCTSIHLSRRGCQT